MAETTGIGWTDGTVNFVIGCTRCGPGCDGCYAAAFALRKMNIRFEPGGRRHVTQSGFTDPVRWQRMRDRGLTTMRVQGQNVPIPTWVFACSLSDFFDKEWPEGVRDRAWAVIRQCHSLRWQIVTKRVGNVERMLPADWDDGRNYPHVGIIATMVNQQEVDRDLRKLVDLKVINGVRWIGLSIEPQIGPIDLRSTGWLPLLDWVITGGESKQEGHLPRPYDLEWPMDLIAQCLPEGVPVFVKQMGDVPFFAGKPLKFKGKGTDPKVWPDVLQIQMMPRVYDDDPVVPEPVAASIEQRGLF